jgi:UDP-2,3-diacylglucosamine hydrolase
VSLNTKNLVESFFVSDIHLKSLQERNAILFLRFLRELKERSRHRPSELFLLGDIFDLWLSNHEVFVERFDSLLFEMKDLVARGVPIYYFEGNHDVHLDVYFEKEIRAEVFVKAQYFKRDD